MSQADIQIPLADVREIYRVTDIERAQEDAPAGRDELQLRDLDASRIQRGKTRMGFQATRFTIARRAALNYHPVCYWRTA